MSTRVETITGRTVRNAPRCVLVVEAALDIEGVGGRKNWGATLGGAARCSGARHREMGTPVKP